MSKRILMLVGLAVAGSWPVPLHAQSPEAIAGMAMMGDGPVLVIPMLLRFADLNAQQTDQVRRIMAADHSDMQEFFNQLADANNELADALLAPADTSTRDANARIQRLAQLRLQLMQSELRTVLAIRKILTPEQLRKVTAALDEMKSAGTSQLEPQHTF